MEQSKGNDSSSSWIITATSAVYKHFRALWYPHVRDRSVRTQEQTSTSWIHSGEDHSVRTQEQTSSTSLIHNGGNHTNCRFFDRRGAYLIVPAYERKPFFKPPNCFSRWRSVHSVPSCGVFCCDLLCLNISRTGLAGKDPNLFFQSGYRNCIFWRGDAKEPK